jgi:MFS family permease
MLAVLLAALDQTIVATALPKISSEFNASDQIGWVSLPWDELNIQMFCTVTDCSSTNFTGWYLIHADLHHRNAAVWSIC